MANLFTVTISDSADALLVTYGAGAIIRVQSSPTEAGAYGDVVTIPIVSGVSTYAVYDDTGTSIDWYKIRFEASDGDPAGAYSAAFQPNITDDLYASLADFKNFVRGNAAEAADDTIMLLALDAAARAIDRATGRSFAIAGTVATARYFASIPTTMAGVIGARRYVVPIDDLSDSTTPTVAFDTSGNGDYDLASTAFRLGPTNAPAKGLPYTELIFDLGTYPPQFEEGVKVTALWGWSAVPSTITKASMVQAHRFLKRRDSPFGIAGSPDMGNELRLLAKLDPDVALMVSAYRRNWGAV